MGARTLLIGLDGATFSILDPMIEQGVMPHLKELLGSGARAKLTSVVPPLTPPAWTSLMTGRTPGNHGIFDFMRFEARPDGRYLRVVDSRDVACETIWSIVTRHGLRATVLNFPLMYPPQPISGCVVPGWVPWRHLRLACHPSDLFDRLKALPGFNARELAMDMALEGKALEGCHQEEDYERLISLHIRREQQWFKILLHLMREEPCELTAILFDGVDKLQHFCWRFIDPECYPDSPSSMEVRIRDLCLDYFREIDQFLAEIIALGGPDTTTLIASDHGFGATTEVFHLNAWLQQNGYLTWKKAEEGEENPSETLGLETMARRFYQVDWDRTVAYCPTPSGNGIYLSPSNGCRGAEWNHQDLRQELITTLIKVADPVTGDPVVSHVWTREEAFTGAQAALAPDLTLSLRDGGFVSIVPSDVVLKPRPEPAGTHRPHGIFIAAGPGIRRGASLSPLSILDVAPTVLYTLGLPIPDDFEGCLPQQLFEPSHIRAYPILEGSRTRPQQGAQPSVMTPDGDMEAEVVKQLKALGYLA